MKTTHETKNLDDRSFLSVLIILLISTNLAIFLNIPFLRQILGFLFLTFLPGLLILQVLKLNRINTTEKFVLSVGLSISFLMLFGLLLNYSLFNLGYETPLATYPLLIAFSIVFIILVLVGRKVNKEPIFSLPNFNLSTSEKALLIVPIFSPALSIFGMNLMNTTNNNIILMFLLFLIPIYVVFICLFNQKIPKRSYPIIIFLISISLLLLTALRWNHIIGSDVHLEYYFFQTTSDNSHWIISGYSTLDACLSISLLPAIYHSILDINPEFLFKILYSLIYSISPLVVYIISKRYIEESYAFLASCFFMFQSYFLVIMFNPRSSVAILFFALAMMTLFNDRIDPLKKRILFIVFIVSCMISHYSTTYIFFFIMFGTFVVTEILSKKYTFKKIISLTTVILFFALIFLWYSQVTKTAFSAGVFFIKEVINNLNKFFIEESRHGAIKGLLGRGFEYPIISRANFIVTWSTFILIGIGVLTTLRRYKEMISISNMKAKRPDFLKTKFEMEYFTITLMCVGLLISIIVLPYVSIGYDLWRLYSVAIVILSVYFIIGGITLSKHFFFFTKRKAVPKEKQDSLNKNTSQTWVYFIILLILIPYSLFSSGVIHQLFGVESSIILESEGEGVDELYIHDQESYAAKWLNEYGEKYLIIYTGHQGMYRLISQGKIEMGYIDEYSLFEKKELSKGYIYLRYSSIIQKKSLWITKYYNRNEISNALYNKTNKIYDSGAVIYKK